VLLLFFLGNTICLRFIHGEIVVLGRILLNLLFKVMYFTLETFRIISQTLEFGLARRWLLQEHLNPLEALTLVSEFTSNDIIAHLAVLARLILQIVKHLLGAEVVSSNLLSVHVLLAN
jgi:hypothetical protein